MSIHSLSVWWYLCFGDTREALRIVDEKYQLLEFNISLLRCIVFGYGEASDWTFDAVWA